MILLRSSWLMDRSFRLITTRHTNIALAAVSLPLRAYCPGLMSSRCTSAGCKSTEAENAKAEHNREATISYTWNPCTAPLTSPVTRTVIPRVTERFRDEGFVLPLILWKCNASSNIKTAANWRIAS